VPGDLLGKIYAFAEYDSTAGNSMLLTQNVEEDVKESQIEDGRRRRQAAELQDAGLKPGATWPQSL